jgi:hypothetical protein
MLANSFQYKYSIIFGHEVLTSTLAINIINIIQLYDYISCIICLLALDGMV